MSLWLTGYRQSVTRVLRPHVFRLTALEVTVYDLREVDTFYAIFSDCSFSALEELRVRYHSTRGIEDIEYDDFPDEVVTYDTQSLTQDRLPRLRRLTIPGFLLAKTAPSTVRHLTVEWDYDRSYHITRISRFQDLLSAIARCQALETLDLRYALPVAGYPRMAAVPLPALRSL